MLHRQTFSRSSLIVSLQCPEENGTPSFYLWRITQKIRGKNSKCCENDAPILKTTAHEGALTFLTLLLCQKCSFPSQLLSLFCLICHPSRAPKLLEAIFPAQIFELSSALVYVFFLK